MNQGVISVYLIQADFPSVIIRIITISLLEIILDLVASWVSEAKGIHLDTTLAFPRSLSHIDHGYLYHLSFNHKVWNLNYIPDKYTDTM